MIEVKDVAMRFRMANDRINSIKEYAIARQRGKLQYNEFEAPKHVSFDVKKGEVVGLIGHNGAGKSTILKVISGILKPTEGCVTVRGNVAPMLELGSGFDFDMTSGMLARLAFSIATVVDPEILIVDEVLSVGDATFVKKSYDRMVSLMQSGTTVLFVSHSIEAVKAICNRAIWLEKGEMMADGDVNGVCNEYESFIQRI